MRVFDGPADVLAAVGERVGPGPWVEITQDRVDMFAAATGDSQWIHVDAVRAATGPFGGTVAHGYLTLALVPMLVADVVCFDDCGTRINYGTERVRFPHPLRVGGRIRAHGMVKDARRSGTGVQVVMHWTVEIEDPTTGSGVGAKPACVADTLVLLVPPAPA